MSIPRFDKQCKLIETTITRIVQRSAPRVAEACGIDQGEALRAIIDGLEEKYFAMFGSYITYSTGEVAQ